MTRRLERPIQAGFALTLLALIVIGVAGLRTAAATSDSATWVSHTIQVQAQLNDAAAQINGAESAALGYALTGGARFYALHDSTALAIPAVIARIRQLTTDNHGQQSRVDSLALLVRDQLISLRRLADTRGAAARTAIALDENQSMVRIREIIRVMNADELRLLDERTARLLTVTREARIAVWAGLLLALAAVAVAGAMISPELRRRQRTEAALAVSEAHYRTILHNVADAVFVTDMQGRYVDVNPKAYALTGYSRTELLQLNASDTYVPEERPLASSRIVAAASGRELSFDRRMLRKDGTVIFIEGTAVLLGDGRILTTLRDISERKRAEDQLRESEQRFRELAENVREVFFVMDPDTGRALYVSPAYDELFGQTREHAYATVHAWTEGIHPDDRDQVVAADKLAAETGVFADVVYRIVRPDASIRWIRGRATPVRNAAGKIIRLVEIAEDITDLKSTEAKSLQSQKMEAVGRLAGGIAHDFNNLLTVILSYGQMQADELAPNDPRRPDLDEIVNAGRRAADLTRQLLAFTRQQVLQPQVLDMNTLVTNVSNMLRRVIGENIELQADLAPHIDCVRADPGGLEQVVMNLVVNARDAMPNGGTVIVETSNVEMDGADIGSHDPMVAGRYVLLAVKDTGEGMDDATKARLFEPFFTTKSRGQGTGLGLATVYGIVKQSGGYIAVVSAREVGTTFNIYLPRVTEPAEALRERGDRTEIRGGSETILLVEDEAGVRKVTRTMLARRGYTVLEAARPDAALALADTLPRAPDLVVTDVILPGLNGRELARSLNEKWPGIKILYLSGYTDDAIGRHGVLEPGVAFLEKPFTPDGLAVKVRQVLDA